ncbi:MAG TPA: diguanylate cyclase [Terriglobales bacterium]|nr:diguanylate cyclase [Terriglobales bacterium]
MTIRRKILLFSALALGAFLAAVYMVSRFALLDGFSRLESDAARENIHHLQNGLKNEQSQLEIMARDYAQWDQTYNYMDTHSPDYVRTELTNDTFKIIHICLFALFDDTGNLVLYKNAGDWSLGDTELAKIAAVQQHVQAAGHNTPLNGILDLDGRLLLLAFQPVLTSRGVGAPRGTLVMARELDAKVLASLSRSMGFTIWMEPAESVPTANVHGIAWNDGSNWARFESDSTLLNYVVVRDFSGHISRFLVGRTPRSLFLEGKKQIRLYWGLLMIAGAVFCGALFFFVDEVLMTRISCLSSEVAKVTVSGDLSLRLDSAGNDELSGLVRAVNSMLTAIQRAKVELLQAQESLRFHAEHDALTGVRNRRAIRDVLRKELARCRRERNSLGVILADVDHFKRVNDHFGHASGDAVLVTVVQRIAATLRPYDLLGRYGGEEFLIIAPGCDLELAHKLAERVRAAVGDEPIDLGNQMATISLSLGVTLGTPDSDPEFLVAQADTAMYQAKRKGRNRVEVGLDLPEDEPLEANSLS